MAAHYALRPPGRVERVVQLASKRGSETQVTKLRVAIVAIAAVIVVAVVGIGLYYARDVPAEGGFVAGTHYALLDDAAAPDPKRPVVVREYFSYYCVHCRNFDPQVEAWRESKPDDVTFERSPVAFSPVWRVMGQGYYALLATGALAENHPRLFRAIHENNRQFLTADSLADFVDGHGVDREAFLAAFNSPDVHRAMSAADLRARAQRIDSVPALVVGDRFRVNLDNVPRAQAFAVVDFLVAEIRAGR
jgi:thiol:disulfide interchange protein DsbA